MKYQPPFDPAFAGAPVNGIYNADANASYVNGNPATGQEGSIPPFEAVEHTMREIMKVITEAGITPNHADLTQLWQALQWLVGERLVESVGGAIPVYAGINDGGAHEIRSIEAGANITLTLVESPASSGQYKIRIAATSGGGGGGDPLLNVGDGVDVFKGVAGGFSEIRGIKALGDGIAVTLEAGGNNILIENLKPGQAGYQNKLVYSYTGADQEWVVPSGVTKAKFKVWAPGGAGDHFFGGAGGYTEAELPVTAGQVYKIVVGQGGVSLVNAGYTANPYGFGGRGYGVSIPPNNTQCSGFAGGGLSGVFLTSVTQGNARVIAGGGGGSSNDSNGNTANQSQGGNGNDPAHSGGAAGMTGEDGSNDHSHGGGGGGYTGGRAGANGQTRSTPTGEFKAGEGGAGYVHSSALTQTIASTVEFDNLPPNRNDVDYISGIGRGGEDDGAPPFPGGNGLIIVYY